MRILKYSLIAAVLAVCCASCTHNNGDIGDLFGTWHTESIVVDGTPLAAAVTDSMFWKFQNDLMCINIPYGYHEAHKSWARYVHDGDILKVDFSYTSDHEDSYNNFTPPAITNLTNGVNELHVVTLTHSSMVLTLGDYTYTFRKQ